MLIVNASYIKNLSINLVTLDLKDSVKELQLQTSLGTLFHVVMVFGKNGCWWDEV